MKSGYEVVSEVDLDFRVDEEASQQWGVPVLKVRLKVSITYPYIIYMIYIIIYLNKEILRYLSFNKECRNEPDCSLRRVLSCIHS